MASRVGESLGFCFGRVESGREEFCGTMAAFVTHHVGVRVEGGLVFRKATCTTRSMRSFRSHCPVRMSVEEDKATTNEAESEKKPSPSLIPMQQGSVPVQTGAQADMLAVKRKPKETEEEESAKVDPIQAAKDEIASLTEIPELTDEQKMRIKRMKKKVRPLFLSLLPRPSSLFLFPPEEKTLTASNTDLHTI